VVRELDFSASALHKRVVDHGSERIFRVGNRDPNLLVLLQRQWLQGPKDPIFIHGFNPTVHLITIVRRNGEVLCCRVLNRSGGDPFRRRFIERFVRHRQNQRCRQRLWQRRQCQIGIHGRRFHPPPERRVCFAVCWNGLVNDVMQQEPPAMKSAAPAVVELLQRHDSSSCVPRAGP